MTLHSNKKQVELVGDEKNQKQRGFSLTELLVALAILSLIMGLAAPRIIGYLSSSKTKTAQIQVEQLKSALELYLIDIGRYPSNDEGLQGLIENVSDSPYWSGPYLDKKTAPTDPWGAAYQYLTDEAAEPVVFSFGADGIDGGEGDNADIFPK